MKLILLARPSEDFFQKYQELRAQITGDGIRWLAQEELHMSICTIADIPYEAFENLIQLIKFDCQQFQAITLQFYALQLKPQNRNARMLWARYLVNPAFESLTLHFRKRFKQLHYTTNKHAPQAHITLARFSPEHAPVIKATLAKKSFPFSLSNLALYQTEKIAEKTHYHPVHSFKLG